MDPPLSSSRACLTTFIAISVPWGGGGLRVVFRRRAVAVKGCGLDPPLGFQPRCLPTGFAAISGPCPFSLRPIALTEPVPALRRAPVPTRPKTGTPSAKPHKTDAHGGGLCGHRRSRRICCGFRTIEGFGRLHSVAVRDHALRCGGLVWTTPERDAPLRRARKQPLGWRARPPGAGQETHKPPPTTRQRLSVRLHPLNRQRPSKGPDTTPLCRKGGGWGWGGGVGLQRAVVGGAHPSLG